MPFPSLPILAAFGQGAAGGGAAGGIGLGTILKLLSSLFGGGGGGEVPGRFQSPWGDLRLPKSLPSPAGRTTGAGGILGQAAGGGPFGLTSADTIMALVAILSSLFGQKEKDPMEEVMQLQQQMRMLGIPKPYQSPYTGMMDRASIQAILNQMKRTANWGWPEGQQMDTGWIEDLLESFPGGGKVPPGTKVRW